MGLPKRLLNTGKRTFGNLATDIAGDLTVYAGKKIYQKGSIGATDAYFKGVDVVSKSLTVGDKAAIGASIGGGVVGLAIGADKDGVGGAIGGTIGGAGLGAIGGGAAGVAIAIAKGIR